MADLARVGDGHHTSRVTTGSAVTMENVERIGFVTGLTSYGRRVPSKVLLGASSVRRGFVCVRHSHDPAARPKRCNKVSLQIVGNIQSHVPVSLEEAVEQTQQALRAAVSDARRRLRVDVDTSMGDETFSKLRNTIPIVALFCKEFVDSIQILMPDAGSAAMLRKQWRDDAVLSSLDISSLDSFRPPSRDQLKSLSGAVLVVSPRATEADALETLANIVAPLNASDAGPSLVIINADWSDLGVTGLGLSARELRRRFLDTIEPVYYLKTTSWGLVFRQYPGKWTVWVDKNEQERAASNENGDFTCIEESLERQPSGDELDSLLQNHFESRSASSNARSGFGGVMRGLTRFLDTFRRG